MEKDGTDNPIPKSLADIREAIAECDALRLDPDLPAADRRSLEEFTAPEYLDDLLFDFDLDDDEEEDGDRVTSMNTPAKALEHVKKFASLVTRILTEVGRW